MNEVPVLDNPKEKCWFTVGYEQSGEVAREPG